MLYSDVSCFFKIFNLSVTLKFVLILDSCVLRNVMTNIVATDHMII